MIYIYLFILIVIMYFSICVRLAVLHPIKSIYNATKDFIKYIKYKEWRVCKTGTIVCFVGLFGKGKTLSAVHKVCNIYKKYNGKKIYDFNRKKWVTQKVNIISNVDLAIPFTPFKSLQQIVDIATNVHTIDEACDTLTITVVLGDEFSVQLNSRSFKTNIDPLFLNTLLTCRHHHISLIYTAQRFNHVDALLRQVTSWVISCNKCWRYMVHAQYDAYQIENANDPTLVKPKKRFGWFISNKDYNAYDTLACVGNLIKSCKAGDMLTEEEIISLQNNNGSDMAAVTEPSRKYKRLQKKLHK